MKKHEFLVRFHLKQLAKSAHNYQHNSTLKIAAVLIGLVESSDNDTGLEVLLTKRSSHLKHHPSQISFPGGKAEPEDESLVATALREASEEIGLSPTSVSVIGQLPSYQIISGYQVTPIVAMIDKQSSYQQDDNEVAEIFQVPLQHFLHANSHHCINAFKNGRKHNIHFFPYKHYNIWGATAAMLKDLTEHIK
ncbi:MAG: CoA pyrophosphatase [Litorilituus sp.]|jgi:8-oxo-dGTP pyrophosphatase MutT (NUDIX family)|nr:CoA pyrophosphatase [Litorilituus sp.]